MIMNRIYVIVTFLMFFFFISGSNEENKKEKSWKNRFYLFIKISFLVVNILEIVFVNKNPYKQENILITVMMILVYSIPIIVYLEKFICYLMKKKTDENFEILWFLYIFCFLILIFVPKEVKTEEVLQEKTKIVMYNENKVVSFNNIFEGIDFIVVKQSFTGETEEKIIKTRPHKRDNKVEIYLHQKDSYIEEYANFETDITFLGTINTIEKKEKGYKIYLTDDMYEKR